MTNENYDIVVIGVGGMGSAALYHLAKRGLRVCGIERYNIAHDRGSSHGETRIIRKAYFEHPDYVPLLHRAYELWYKLEKETNRKLLVKNGLIAAGKENSETIQNLESCYREHALPHERWNIHEAQKHFPQFKLSEDMVTFYDPLGGFLYVESCVEQHAALAQQHGAKLYTNENVISWDADQNNVHIRTEKRKITADKLIITTGAWTKKELEKLGVDIEIWRRTVFWYDSPDIFNYRPDVFPTFYIESDYGAFYGFPAINNFGFKIGEHAIPDIAENPDKLNRDLDPNDESPFLRFINGTFPDLKVKRTRYQVCMYTQTPDHNFIVDFHPEYTNVAIAGGFSGHGFKFSPIIGEILVDLVTKGATLHPIDFLRFERFFQK